MEKEARAFFRGLYQKLHDETDYGRADKDKCPALRYWDFWQSWLSKNSKIVDVGCGTGDTVKFLREQGYTADGIDWIRCDNGMIVADISRNCYCGAYDTVISFDTLEHLDVNDIPRVLAGMSFARQQIITIHSGPSLVPGKFDDIDLHLTKEPFDWWRGMLSAFFTICTSTRLTEERSLFICQTRWHVEEPDDEETAE